MAGAEESVPVLFQVVDDARTFSKMLQILRMPAVEALTGLKKTRINELERDGRFPKRVRISDRATGYRSDEVEAWIKALPRDVDADTGDQLRSTSSKDRAKGAYSRAAKLNQDKQGA